MAVRYTSSFKSDIGITWKIDLHDTEFSGSATSFTVAGEGFALERNASNQERTSALLGSEVTVYALSQNSSFDNWLRTLVFDGEAQHFCVIYKDNVKWWVGQLLMDIYEEDDTPYPRLVRLRYTDGLARLKEIEYTDSGTRFTGTATIIEHIWNVLALVPTLQFWNDSGETVLRTSCEYFESQMSYSNTTDPLPSIRVPHAAFWKEQENGEYDIMNAYDVLEQLVANFYARFWLGDGYFHFVQLDRMRNNLLRVFDYDKDGTSSTSNEEIELRIPLDQQKNGLVKLAGMRTTYFSALASVRKKYRHDTSGNFLPSPLLINAASRSIGDVDTNGGDAWLSVQGAIRLSIINDIPSTGVIFVVRVRFKIKQGTRYLKRAITSAGGNTDYSAMAWTTTSTDTVEYYTGGIVKATTTGREIHTRSIQVDFASPQLLNDGAVEVELISVAADVLDPAGGTVSNVSVTGEFDGYIEYSTSNDAENERDFKADNGLSLATSRILQLPDARFGDEINSSTRNAIEVWDGSAWVRSDTWKKKNETPALPLYQLVCKEVLSGQTSNVKKLIIDLRGDFSFLNTMLVSPSVYLPLSGVFNANSAVWTGMEMFLHTYETAQVTTAGEAAPIDRNLIQPPSVNFTGGGIPIDETVRLAIGSVNPTDTLGNVTVGPPITGITGSNNLLLGGGSNLTTGSNNILIGADASSATVSNELNIGDVILGDLSAGTVRLPNLATGTETGIVAYDANNKLIQSQLITIDGVNVTIGSTANSFIGTSVAGGSILGYGVSRLINGGSLVFSRDNNVRFRVNLGGGGYWIGSVGVNTTSPTATLDVNGQARIRAYGLGNVTGTASTYVAFDASGNLIEYTLQDFFALVPAYDTNAAAAVDLAVGETYYNNLLNTYTRVT